MAKTLIDPPVALPVTLAEIKAHLRIDIDDEDSYLDSLATVAVAHVEAASGRLMIEQTWRVFLDDWPDGDIVDLPLSPVRSIAAITVYDADGNGSALAASAWQLDAASDPPRLLLFDPPAPGRQINGIEIDVVAGFGAAANEVPDGLKRAILVLAAHWHELRGSGVDAAQLGLEPAGFRRLLSPFRGPRL